MPTDEERREAARRLREEADYPGHAVQYMEQFIGDLRQVLFGDLNPTADYSEMFARLADFIEPTGDLDLDAVQRVCFERMEGCDEPEWTLYTTIYDAIARYKRWTWRIRTAETWPSNTSRTTPAESARSWGWGDILGRIDALDESGVDWSEHSDELCETDLGYRVEQMENIAKSYAC